MHSALGEFSSSQGAIAFYTQRVMQTSDFDKLNKGDLVFFFINDAYPEDEFSNFTKGFRRSLYKLFPGNDWQKPIFDLGNLKQGNTANDTLVLLREVMAILYSEYGVMPIVLGGGDEVDYILFEELSKHHAALNVVEASALVPDLRNKEHFISRIIDEKRNSLFQYTQLGYQQCLNNASSLKGLSEMYFESVRLGELRENLTNMEPRVRNAQFASFRMDVLRTAELVPSDAVMPNGLFSFELCQLMWYTSFSSNLKVAHISKVSYSRIEGIALANLSQMFWHLMDGYQEAVEEKFNLPKNFLKYTVLKGQNEWIFYKSKRTERWWVEVNSNVKDKIKILIPCTLDDYNSSLSGEIPESWFRHLSKIN